MIDFHCHLDLYPDPEAVARECAERRLYVLSVTTAPSAWFGTKALGRHSERIKTGLGLHPQLAHERKGEVDLFERFIGETRYVGEIGLDGTPEHKRHWADQMAVFTRLLDICSDAGGRILSIHSRRAATAVLDVLEAVPGAGVPVLHWFSGSQRELARAIDLGCWFSVGPAMLWGEKGRALVARMPRGRVLTESDGPFAQREGSALFPWDIGEAITCLSYLWSEPPVSVQRQLLQNLRRLVGNKGKITSENTLETAG